MNYSKLPLVVLLSICISGLLAIVPAGAQGRQRRSSAVIAPVIQTVIQPDTKTLPIKRRVTIKIKRTINEPIVPINDVWGPIEDYRDGYQQGFEAGYSAGYERQQFNSVITGRTTPPRREHRAKLQRRSARR